MIIGGLSLGMLSTALPILIVVICVMAAYVCSGGFIEATRGLYGIALSAVGMLSTLGITLATVPTVLLQTMQEELRRWQDLIRRYG